jgi:hypothetical protein
MIPTQPMFPPGPPLDGAAPFVGGALPPDQGGGLPPELIAAALQGGGAGLGADQGPPSPAHGDGVDSTAMLRMAIEYAQAALVGEPSDADSQKLADAIKVMYRVLSDRQKNQDQLLGGNPALAQTLRRLGG